MFEQLFGSASTVERYRTAPLVGERLRYLTHWLRLGAKRTTLRKIACNQVVVVRLLDLREGSGAVDREQIEAAAAQWARPRLIRRSSKPAKPAAVAEFVARAARWLRFLNRLRPAPVVARHQHVDKVTAFADWMRRERGLSEHTIGNRCRIVDEFLSRFRDEDRPLQTLTIADIDQVVAEKSAAGRTRVSICSYTKRLRAFFRYAERQGWSAPGLAAAIIPPRMYWNETIPAGLAWEDVQRLLRTTEGEHPTDKRDRAVVLLFAVYGLRSGEVSGLRLDDIDWEQETLQVRRPKPGRTHRYPLARSVGEALIRYLREVRPACTERSLFLTLRAPIRPLATDGVRAIVSGRLRRLGVVSQRGGAHALRYACAQHLLDQGMSLQEVGDHLGHRSPNTAAGYAKINLPGLRQVADFDLEGLI